MIREDYIRTEFVFLFPLSHAHLIEPAMADIPGIIFSTEVNVLKPHDLINVYHIWLNPAFMDQFVKFMQVLHKEQTALCHAGYRCEIGNKNSIIIQGRML